MSDLTNTKEGDRLIISRGGFGEPTVKTVTRTTPTRVYCGSTAFTRAGHEIGAGKWHGAYARHGEPEVLEEIQEEQKRRKYIHDIQVSCPTNRLNKMPTSQLAAILAALQEPQTFQSEYQQEPTA